MGGCAIPLRAPGATGIPARGATGMKTPEQLLREYCENDVRVTAEVYRLIEEIERQRRWALWTRLCWFLHRMQRVLQRFFR